MTIEANIEAIPAFVEPPVRAPVLTFLGEIGLTGNLSLVTPCPIHWLPAVIIGLIDYAEDLQRRGQTDLAVIEVRRIEKVLKITDADRLAATRATEEWELGFLEIMADMAPAPTKEAALALPADAGRFTPTEERDLDSALAKLRRAKNAGSRESALKEINRIRQRPRQRLENDWRTAAMKETAALATGRGEEIDHTPSRGGMRIDNRDGLKTLFDKGRLTKVRYGHGLLFRTGWEGRSGDLGALNYGDGGGGAHDNDRFVARRCLEAVARLLVPRSERAVAALALTAKPKPHPEALKMLQRIAGDGFPISAFGEGRAQQRNLDALNFALDVVEQTARAIREEERRARAI